MSKTAASGEREVTLEWSKRVEHVIPCHQLPLNPLSCVKRRRRTEKVVFNKIWGGHMRSDPRSAIPRPIDPHQPNHLCKL